MVRLNTPICNFGQKASDFTLPDTKGNIWTLGSSMGKNGLLVMFICNHCPYVKAIQTRLVLDTRELLKHGVNSVAIMSNDSSDYPEDSPENMRKIAEQFNYPFPYLFDQTQEVAKTYGAVCTPDFFGFNNKGELQYRGRLDASNRETAPANVKRELFDAMLQIAKTSKGPKEQTPSIGCSIKWRNI